MSTTRREFLHKSLAAGALFSMGGVSATALARDDNAKAGKSLRILILGGTGFLGPALVDVAQDRGHTITVFNRGRTEERIGRLPGEVERLIGDRDPDKGEGLNALESGAWDVVIDNSGYYPRMVKASAEIAATRSNHYIFVSSISAYKHNHIPNQDETAELATLEDPNVETMGAQFQYYGGLKAACERAAETAMPGRTSIVRPGYIVGPGDPTDRFTYWPLRVQRGGEVLAPGTPNDPIQIIDVRDLAAWMIHLCEANITGAFNACGPTEKLSMQAMLDACKAACGEGSPGAHATFTYVSHEFIEKYPEPVNVPIWAPPTGETAGFHTWSNARAVKAGLKFRPVRETAHDVLQWWPREQERRTRVGLKMIEDAKQEGKDPPELLDLTKLRAGLTAEDEAKALQAWRGKGG